MIRFLADNLRWLAAGFLMMFMSAFGQTYFISLFSGEIRAELGLSHGGFGTIYGAATLLSAASLVWVGKLADRHDLAPVGVLVSLVLCAAALSMSLVTGPIFLFVAIFGLRLFGQGMMTHVPVTAVGRWFVATRGRALALAGLGAPVSEAVFPPLVVALLLWFGWRDLWQMSAAVLMLFAAPVLFLLLRRNRSPRATAAETGIIRTAPRDWTRAEVLRDPVFYALMAGLLAPPFVGTGIFFHQVHLVETKGWKLVWFASGFSLYATFQVVAGLVAGWLVDRWSARRVVPYVLLAEAAGAILLGLSGNPLIIAVSMSLFGTTAGLMSTVGGALWPEIYGTLHLGAIRALAISAMVFATAGSPFLLGVLIDAGIAFDVQLIAMGLYTLAASGVLLAASRILAARQEAMATG